jgi:hypothetical protein
MEDIYEHLKLDEGAIACRDRVDQKISNMLAVPRDFKRMVMTDEPKDVIKRLRMYLDMVEARGVEGKEAALAFKRQLRARRAGDSE